MKNNKSSLFASGGLLAAMVSYACCTLPFILGGIGVSSGWLSTYLEPIRPYLIVMSLIILASAHYFAWRPKRNTSQKEFASLSDVEACTHCHNPISADVERASSLRILTASQVISPPVH